MRNTAFDTWTFTGKAATIKNAAGVSIQAPKAIEHQNEMSYSGGGFVPKTGHKLFFFAAYDQYHSRKGASYTLYNIPTASMVQGDFTELVTTSSSSPVNPIAGQSGTGSSNPAFLFNPLTNTNSASACAGQIGAPYCRTPLTGPKPGSGVVSNNVIPSNLISPIAKAMQQWMPAPTNPSVLVGNYLGGYPGGYDNHAIDWRVDYDLSAKQRISSVGAMGAMNYLNNYGSPYLPLPYTGGDLAHIFPKDYVISDTYTFSPNLVNQLKMSFTRFYQNIQDSTDGVTAFGPPALGMTNIPAGQAGREFPGESFATTSGFGTALQTWTTNGSSVSTQLTTPNNYAITDNVQWMKGKHSLTFGLTYQFQDDNNANPATYSGWMSLPFTAYATAAFTTAGALTTGGTGYMGQNGSTAATTSPYGYSYASFLLGAVGGSPTLGLQPVSELAGRFKPYAPYAEDIIKLTPKLTLDLGLRWDYMPPYHEAQNRWTFLNPGLTNPLTNTLGLFQFAGNWGGAGVSCGGCKTPVKTYWMHFGPRASIAYQLDNKTVLRAGFAQVYSQAGGVGGRGGAAGGTGQTGFNMTAAAPAETTSSVTAAPSYYLNNSTGFTSAGAANTSLFGPGYVYPSAPTPGVLAQELNTGFVLCPSSGIGPGGNACSAGKMLTAGSASYADPYLSGRAPEFVMWNAGFERAITPDLTLGINYVGNESHFIINSGTNGANARGYWVNQLDPKYLVALGPVKSTTGTPILTAAATTANVALAAAAMPGISAPSFFTAAAAVSTSATIAQMLTAFPQYSGVSDTWGNVGNFSYEAVQVSLNQRMAHGLSFNFNYTFSKNIGDDGSFRSGYYIPAAALSNNTGGQSWPQDRMDRSYTVISIPNKINAFGVYQLPFGKGHIGNNSRIVRWAAGGWQLSGIYTFSQGTPIGVTWSGCTSTTYPGQGQCMPDINPSYPNKSAHINGKWGSGPNGFNTCNLGINALGQSGCTAIHYLDNTAFQTPQSVSTVSATPQYLLGNAPREHAFQLRGPYTWNIDSGLRRSIPIREGISLVVEADCLNTLNHTTMGGPSASWASGSTSFGNISGTSGNRDWQFAGHFIF